jgi:TetR/AcrR family transcriptional regulator, regulator of cefoperazone and chloramphenicol sensitivity
MPSEAKEMVPNPDQNRTSAEKNARSRLLGAGLDEFGRYGFEAATTRRIAQRAAVNIALIPYYFGGKEGLYGAVVEHVIGHIESHVRPILQEIKRRQDRNLSSRDAVDLLLELLAGIIDFMVGSEQAPRFARIILREQLYPSAAYNTIFSRMMAPVLQAIARMVSIAVGTPLTETVQLRALSLMGQVMAFRVARETVVRMLGMQGYSPAETEQIRHIILEQTEAMLIGLAEREKELKS